MEPYRSAIDVHRIAVIPDHRFLWFTCSRCLFSSVCLNVSVDLQQTDSTVVPLLSPCNRVEGQVALAPSLINQSVWLTSPALWRCLHVFQGRFSTFMLICCGTSVCQHTTSLPARQEPTMLSDNFLTFAPGRSIWASNLIPPINKGAALSNRQRKKETIS